MPSFIEKIEEASKDLLYMSESDYPLEPFVWKREAKPPPNETEAEASEDKKADKEVTAKKHKTKKQVKKEISKENASSSSSTVLAPPTPAAATAADVLKNAGREAGAKVEEITLEQFFHRATKIEDWYGDEEKESAQKFSDLQKLIETDLKDIKVFRVGEIEIDIYVVGVDADGNLAGLKTTAIET
jgi:hypothetical protein